MGLFLKIKSGGNKVNIEDKDVNESKVFEKFFKSLICTLLVFIISLFGVRSIAAWLFPNMSPSQSDTWIIISLIIGVIFTIFYCTFTIIEKINKNIRE